MPEASQTLRAPARIDRLRLAVSLTLAVVALRLVADRGTTGESAFRLLLLFGLPAAVAAAALVASLTAIGRRHAGTVIAAYTVGLAGIAVVSLALAELHPLVVADALFALMMFTLVFFEWSTRRMVAFALAACVGMALGVQSSTPHNQPELAPGFALRSMFIGAAAVVASAYLLDRLRDNLAAREHDLVTLSARLMSVQEEERRRLARDLHDGVGQSLTAILSYLWLIEHELPADAATLRGRTAEARRLAATTMTELRELSQLLRPAALDDYGLVPSIESHCRAFAERERIPVRFDADVPAGRLTGEAEIAVYRITQEALTNVARHARASRVRVTLRVREGQLILRVEDDGVGIARTGGGGGGSGLIGIRERARALGGNVEVQSTQGTRLVVRLPLEPPRVLPDTPSSA
jgi:two-component system sensor histidine kinase UhpB